MKLILDFETSGQIKFTTSNDNIHSYILTWKDDEETFSLWYDENTFVWEKKYENVETAVANVTASLVEAMKDLKYVQNK